MNERIDLSSERLAYLHAHPSLPVGILPFGGARPCAGTIYLVFDMEYARFGLVNLQEAHRLLMAEIEALR